MTGFWEGVGEGPSCFQIQVIKLFPVTLLTKARYFSLATSQGEATVFAEVLKPH